jgi:hypothetical protein
MKYNEHVKYDENQINFGSSVSVNIKIRDSVRVLAHVRGVKMYVITNEALNEYLSKPENAKLIEEFNKIQLQKYV